MSVTPLTMICQRWLLQYYTETWKNLNPISCGEMESYAIPPHLSSGQEQRWKTANSPRKLQHMPKLSHWYNSLELVPWIGTGCPTILYPHQNCWTYTNIRWGHRKHNVVNVIYQYYGLNSDWEKQIDESNQVKLIKSSWSNLVELIKWMWGNKDDQVYRSDQIQTNLCL